MKPTHRRAALIAMAVSVAALASACSGGSDEAPIETNVVNIGEPENLATENIVVGNIVASPSPTAAPVDTSADFSDPTTTQDDADAVGMTSRVDRTEGNGTAPTE